MNNNTLTNNIKETLSKEEKTAIRITRTLKFLEMHQYALAIKVIELAMTEVEFIEQKLCLMHLHHIAINANNAYTDSQLTLAYDI